MYWHIKTPLQSVHLWVSFTEAPLRADLLLQVCFSGTQKLSFQPHTVFLWVLLKWLIVNSGAQGAKAGRFLGQNKIWSQIPLCFSNKEVKLMQRPSIRQQMDHFRQDDFSCDYVPELYWQARSATHELKYITENRRMNTSLFQMKMWGE